MFAGVAGFTAFSLSTGRGDTLRRVHGRRVTGAFYDTLGLRPAAGRLLTRDDDVSGAPAGRGRQLQLSGSASSRGNPAMVGSTIRRRRRCRSTIVGVSPRGFTGANVGAVADLTVPVAAHRAPEPGPGVCSAPAIPGCACSPVLAPASRSRS